MHTPSRNPPILIGIDQGTTGTTILAVDRHLNTLESWYGTHAQHRTGPNRLEHDPQEILNVVVAGVADVLKRLGKAADAGLVAGLANQGETVCVFDTHTGLPVHPAIVWSDTRGGERIEALTAADRRELHRITGLQPDSYFSAAKYAWLLEHVAEAAQARKQGHLALGTLDSWLIWKLTSDRRFITDASTASRTLLYDLQRGCWSDKAAGFMQLPTSSLARIVPSCGSLAMLGDPSWDGRTLDLRASLVDQPASLFGHGCWEPGQTKITYGTGCFMLMNSGAAVPSQETSLLCSVAWQRGEARTLMCDAGVYAAGSLIGWLQKNCEWVSRAEQLDEIVATAGPDEDLAFVPCLDGLAAPHWRRDAKGMLTGLTLATRPADIIRAALDGIAQQIVDIADCALPLMPQGIPNLRVDGGLSGCRYLMQKQADLLGIPVYVSENRERTALGAAAMAGLAAGVWTPDELLGLLRGLPAITYTPRIDAATRTKERCRWHQAVGQVLKAADFSRQGTLNG
jgi:glycerol kinase